MEHVDHLKGCDAFDLTNGTHKSQASNGLRQMGSHEKKASVHAEISRVNQLPSNSSYAIHRMRVLNKLLHLMSIQRTILQDEELELLFAGLSL